jgi:hypothetical protein
MNSLTDFSALLATCPPITETYIGPYLPTEKDAREFVRKEVEKVATFSRLTPCMAVFQPGSGSPWPFGIECRTKAGKRQVCAVAEDINGRRIYWSEWVDVAHPNATARVYCDLAELIEDARDFLFLDRKAWHVKLKPSPVHSCDFP